MFFITEIHYLCFLHLLYKDKVGSKSDIFLENQWILKHKTVQKDLKWVRIFIIKVHQYYTVINRCSLILSEVIK